MPRIRTIKPEIWHDERLGTASIPARLLFVGLVTQADDAGRLRGNPALIAGQVFPYDETPSREVDDWLTELAELGLIVRYTVGSECFIALPAWSRHQRIQKPSDKVFPPPPKPSATPTGKVSDRSGSAPELVADSFVPRARPGSKDRRKGSKDQGKDLVDLFAYWQQKCGHPSAKFTPDREKAVRARLADGYQPDDIRRGIDGAARAPTVNEKGVVFDDLELICRSGSKLENFIGRAKPAAGSDGERRDRRMTALENLWARTGAAS